MKLFILFYLLIFVTFGGYSQSIKGRDFGNLTFKIVEKHIVDTAKVNIFYTLDFRLDPKKPEKMKHAQTFLQIGKHSRCFKDYNDFLSDSINDDCATNSINSSSGIIQLMNVGRKIKYYEMVMHGYLDGKLLRRQKGVLVQRYEFEDSIPLFDWIITERDSTILNYKCKMATCHYRGRDYEAWFAEGISMPYGPDVFGGLPGLIMDIHDTQDHYHFKLNGLYTLNHTQLIYKKISNKVIPSSRKKARKVYKYSREFPAQAIEHAFPNPNRSLEAMAKLKPKPYNPMELE
ncbi:GLPGLI family protein [Halosquirtibacter xylanolyticus]|uniref:GLPGLI family protein n=1 Tax=Halosquirtibacter xylanolyticus TaxID=3374599 RepID=UPI003748BEB2|nr:GLPGLI family protein [Prolixibacteraceae bacterium]